MSQRGIPRDATWAVRVSVMLAIALLGLVIGAGGASANGEAPRSIAALEVVPHRAFYTPGERVTIIIEAPSEYSPPPEAVVHLEIVHLTEVAARLTQAADSETRWTFSWDPPEASAGYGVAAWVESGDVKVAYGESAFDVARKWTEQPRYGFLSEFGAWDGAREREAFSLMNRLHLNGVQFYDWQYRHEELVPPTERFHDSLGRSLSVESIEGKIRLAREYGMAPMAYTAIYAASPSFYVDHREWALQDASGKPIDFGSGYLYLMNPARGTGWHTHLIDQFRHVLSRFDFEGIHVDQYGYPRVAYDQSGRTIVMAQAFRHFIDDAKKALSQEFERNDITFNSVANWPAAVMAQSEYDFNYVEVWAPYVSYGDIERIIREAYANSQGKPTVIAAYVDPEEEATVRFLNAIIFANGGTHIEMGEGDGMLADPYFPKFRRVSSSLWQAQVKAYDFIVRYKEWLYGPRQPLDASATVLIEGEPATTRPEAGKIHAVLARSLGPGVVGGGSRHVLSLINLTSASSVEWSASQPAPKLQREISVTLTLEAEPKRVWVASPDWESAAAVWVPHTTVTLPDGGVAVNFTVPQLHYWTVAVLE